MVLEMNCKGRGAFTNVTLNFFYCSIFYVKFMLILNWKLHSHPLGFEHMKPHSHYVLMGKQGII